MLFLVGSQSFSPSTSALSLFRHITPDDKTAEPSLSPFNGSFVRLNFDRDAASQGFDFTFSIYSSTS
jgi:hypothetical protein